MRGVRDKDQFTPVGLFIREHCLQSELGLSVQNIDYLIHDYKRNYAQMIEEKSHGAFMPYSQRQTFMFLDEKIRDAATCAVHPFVYWGVFLLQLAGFTTFPGPGMKLNGVPITVEELVQHINFERQHVEGLTARTAAQLTVPFNGGHHG